MTMEERKAAGLLWTDTEEYLEAQAKGKDLMYEFNQLRPSEVEKRDEIMRKLFGSVGENVWMQQPVMVVCGSNVTIGNNCYFNAGTTLLDDYKIVIGNNVLISPNVTIITTGHPLHPEMRMHGEMYSAAVTIEDDAWIGACVTLLPGVTIGRGAMVGAGSVVTKDVPPMTVAVGNPCKVLRAIGERDREYYFHDRKFSENEGIAD